MHNSYVSALSILNFKLQEPLSKELEVVYRLKILEDDRLQTQPPKFLCIREKKTQAGTFGGVV